MADLRLREIGESVKSILANQYTVVVVLGAVIGIAGFIFNIPPFWWGEYVIGLLLIFVLIEYTKKRSELASLKESNHIVFRRREASLLVLEKEIVADVKEDEPDIGTYNLDLTSAFEEAQVESFPALLKTDTDIAWSDLNFSVQNADPIHEERERTINGEEKRFLLPCDFERAISRPEHYQMSYSIKNELLSPSEDWVSLEVREPTRIGRIRIELPPGWQVRTRRCYDIALDESSEKVAGDDRHFDLHEDGRIIEWSRTDPEIGHEYRIEWTAKPTDQQ